MIALKKPQIESEEIEAVVRVMQTGAIAQGAEVSEFEKEFADFCGTKHAIAVNSGTAALHAILASLNLKPEEEVITTPFSFVATISPILMCGAKPVFADICPKTFNLDPGSVEKCITANTKAIIAVDLFGLCADWTELRKISSRNKLVLVEDACQAHGAYRGGKAGSLGDAAAFSFYATKNMTTAEGGMITTNNDELAKFAKRFRQHGMEIVGRYNYAHLGYNYRTTDIAAAIGRVQLKKLPDWTRRRIEIANYLNSELSGCEGIEIPYVPDECTHVYHLYTIKVGEDIRDSLVEKIRSKGVGCGIYYPTPLYKVGLTPDYPITDLTLNVEKLCRQVLSLPCEPYLTQQELGKIVKAVRESVIEIGKSCSQEKLV